MSGVCVGSAPRLLLSSLVPARWKRPYQASEGRYGYSEQQIEEDRYRVIFAGNPSTPRETVQNYLLYRSAELTVQNGYDYFTVTDRDVERSTRYYTQGYYDDFGFAAASKEAGAAFGVFTAELLLGECVSRQRIFECRRHRDGRR